MRFSLFGLLGFLSLLAWAMPESHAQTSVRFTPEGAAKHVTQVRVHYDQDVVAIGEKTAPFQVECPFAGQGRFVTTKDWVYDFQEPLPAGHRCSFTTVLKKDLSGKALAIKDSYSFHTGGPQIISIDPDHRYARIDEDQLFALKVDSLVSEATLSGRLYFEIPQIANPVAAKIISFDEIRKQNPEYARRFEKITPLPLFVQAASRFPTDKTIQLVWSKGIESRNGVGSLDRQVFPFKTQEAFTVSSSCTRATKTTECSPFDDISLNFSSAVSEKAEITVDGLPKGKVVERHNQGFTIPAPHTAGSKYTVRFSKPFQDDAGRDLMNPADLVIGVGRYPPLIKFPSKFGILEWKGDPRLPVHLRTVEAGTKARVLKIELPTGDNKNIVAFAKALKVNRSDDLSKALLPDGAPRVELREIPGYVGKDKFEVRGLPLPDPGLYQLEVASADLGRAYAMTKMYVHAQALVTDMVIHWKKTDDNVLAWVTSLATGLPVSGASVAIYDCELRNVGRGTTDAKGTLFLAASQTPINECSPDWPGENNWDKKGSLITAAKDKDFTFLISSDNIGIESWRFGLSEENSWDKIAIHTILDRSLFRAGETLSSLTLARKRVLDGFAIPTLALDKQIEFIHSGSGKVFKQSLSWDSQGRSQARWDIPKDAPIGTYEIRIGSVTTGSFSVKEFRVATVKAQLTPAATLAVAPKELSYNFSVNYLNGGAANDLNTTLRARLDYAPPFTSADYSDYSFQGIGAEPDGELIEADKDQLKSVSTKLDATGQGAATLKIPNLSEAKTIRLELEYPDANGQLRTLPFSQTIWPADIVIGLKSANPEPYKQRTPYDFQGVVLDLKEQPLENKLTIRRYKKTYLSHRRRSIGGTYTYESKTVISDEVKICETKSSKDGRFSCTTSFAEPGNYLIRAESEDKAGRRVVTELGAWVDGSQRWYAADDHDRMDLIADKKLYEPGETAKILVKAPFAKGQILFATEREGIKTYEVKEFDAKSPYISVPIIKSYAPNMYVSAWLIRGRVKGTEPFLQVDLGKPAFKLGITELKVGWSQHTLKVDLKTDKKDYKPREIIKLSVDVKSPSGALPSEAVVTIAAVDEGLLEIEGNTSWNLLTAMMGERAYTGQNATASMQVVGKRHFGLKAVPSGGGGGSGSRGGTRELFDTLIKWSAIAPLKNGHADIEIPLNDSLTGFRLVAIAHAGADLFGTGETTIHSSKELSLFSGIPDTMRNGDTFSAEVTLRNSSNKPMDVKVQGSANSNVSLGPQTVSVEANASKKIVWPVTVPDEVRELVYTITAESPGVSDNLQVKQRIVNPVPMRAILGQISPLETTLDIPLSLPAEAREAEIRVTAEASLGASSLVGVREYMTSYPHTCMEQKLSRAVALGRKDLWDQSKISGYLDNDGLLKFFPSGPKGSVELTAYALELSFYQNWNIPEDTKNRMLEALTQFVQGRLNVPGAGLFVEDKIRALAALALWGKAADNKPSLENMDLNPTYLSLPSLIDLRRVYESLEESKRSTVDAALTERSEFRGSIMTFKTEDRTLLGSEDASLARLILSRLKTDKMSGDLPTYIRSLLSTQKQGHWDTTVADALGTLAIQQFAKAFESTAVKGDIQAVLGDVKKSLNIEAKDKKPEVFPWPKGSSTLNLSRSAGSQGKVWITTLALAAVPLQKPESSGIQLTKTFKKIDGRGDDRKTGDIYEVTISYKTNVRIDWGALTDPIPSGARILPGDYGASYTEPGFEGMRAYFDTIAPGEHTFSYKFQLNTRGTFILPPTRMEAMYTPEVFGMVTGEVWKVE